MSEKQPVLKLEQVTKVKDKKVLVDDLSFSVYAGEVFGFLGPNGAGKTTTIKMITGLYHLTKGEIYIMGHSVQRTFEQALSHVGAIIENPEMYGYLSGRDNLKLYARMHGAVSEERLNEVIQLVKLGNRIDDKVKKYSLGMRQRLGLAQALLHRPKLIILDEPTNGLDPMGIKELRETLRALCEQEGVAVLVSSHLLSEMELMCDRFCIIEAGKFKGIRSLHELENVKRTYQLDVSNLAHAMLLLEKVPSIQIKRYDEYLRVVCEKEEVSELIKQLVQGDVAIYEVSNVTQSLEDEFMALTASASSQIR